MERIITEDDNAMLIGQLNKNEIWETLKWMFLDKAPRPDGMKIFFFRQHWDIVGLDVITMVKDFFPSWTVAAESQ